MILYSTVQIYLKPFTVSRNRSPNRVEDPLSLSLSSLLFATISQPLIKHNPLSLPICVVASNDPYPETTLTPPPGPPRRPPTTRPWSKTSAIGWPRRRRVSRVLELARLSSAAALRKWSGSSLSWRSWKTTWNDGSASNRHKLPDSCLRHLEYRYCLSVLLWFYPCLYCISATVVPYLFFVGFYVSTVSGFNVDNEGWLISIYANFWNLSLNEIQLEILEWEIGISNMAQEGEIKLWVLA